MMKTSVILVLLGLLQPGVLEKEGEWFGIVLQLTQKISHF
jgi:hypothetical protein